MQPSNQVVPLPKQSKQSNATVPPVPTGLTVKVDTATGVVSLSWTPVQWPSLAGYAVVLSYSAPAEIKGYALELSSDSLAVAPGDLVFVDRKDYTFNRSKMSPRIWNAEGGSNPSMLNFQVCAFDLPRVRGGGCCLLVSEKRLDHITSADLACS
jgi:hypothetical protein